MTRLDDARRHLETAIAHLEMAAKAASAGGGNEKVHEKLAGELAEALQATQAEYGALRETTASVSERLDAVIGRLRAVLGG